MTPAARYGAAIEILDAVIAGAPAERELTRWARASRFAGSKDRAAIRDIVFGCLRQRRSSLWFSGAEAESGYALVLGAILQTAPGDLVLFDGQGYAPPRPDAAMRAGFRTSLDGAPEGVALDYPDVLGKVLDRSLGPDKAKVMAALRERAPVDLRVNLLKADPVSVRADLSAEGIETVPVDGVATALRVTEGARQVARSEAYRDGAVELQDAASQRVALATGVGPGLRVLDLCAGGGGKTLALGAMMAGQGHLSAYDIDPRRMKDIPARARRAGLEVELLDTATLDARTGFYDLVLVDAPCSGTGAWRRNPDHKWRLTGADLRRLEAVQAQVLERALGRVRPGGRIIYVTCSILVSENQTQVAAFLARHPELEMRDAWQILPGTFGDGFYFAEIALP